MAKGVRFLPVFIILAMLASIVNVSAIALYEESGTFNLPDHSWSGVAYSPELHPEGVEFNFKLTTGPRVDSTGFTSFGYYVIANGQSTAFTLKEGDNYVKTNQFLGFWAKNSSETVYSAKYARNDKNASSLFSTSKVGQVDMDITKTFLFIPYTVHVGTVDILPWPVPADDTPDGGEGGNTTTGAPLPEALASLFLMGGLGGSLSLRKRRKK